MSVTILQGDALAVLRGLESESVQCCVTSPPYWGLRSYGSDPVVYGGDSLCDHAWETDRYYRAGGNSTNSRLAFSEAGPENAQRLNDTRWREDTSCAKCGAWSGHLGLERSPEQYIEHLVMIFREVRRVLRRDGVLWLNLGDSYATHARGHNGFGSSTLDAAAQQHQAENGSHRRGDNGYSAPAIGLKDKDLVMMPHRVALALQGDGWWVRADCVWAKENPMPESVTDRPTRSHEYVFLITRSQRYYYDGATVREPIGSGPSDIRKMVERKERIGGLTKRQDDPLLRASACTQLGRLRSVGSPDGRNRRSVWTIPTSRFRGAHFATFPEKLIGPLILAGCPAGGTILDPFAGAGTTGVVAAKLGRRAILVELNPKYVEIIEERLAQTTPGLPLQGEEAIS